MTGGDRHCEELTHPPSVIARSAEGTTRQSLVREYSTNENEGTPKERLLRPLTGPRNDRGGGSSLRGVPKARRGNLWYRKTVRTGMTAPQGAASPYLSLRGAKRRSNLWYVNTVRTRMREPQERDCFGP